MNKYLKIYNMKFLLLLSILLTCNSFLLPAQEKSFEETLESINKRLEKWTKGNTITVSANRDGNIIIINKRKDTFRFNMFDLVNLTPDKPDEINGIELEYCDRKAHAPLSWINFNTDKGTVAFIRLDCSTPVEELNNIYNDFVQLKSFCTKIILLNFYTAVSYQKAF